MALSITHTPVYCTDLDEALAFYTQRLGLAATSCTRTSRLSSVASVRVSWRRHILGDSRLRGTSIVSTTLT